MIGVRTKNCEFLEDVCNSALPEEVSSLRGSLLILESLNPAGILVVVPLPAPFVYSADNYYLLQTIIAAAVLPEHVCVRSHNMLLVSLENRSKSTSRAFYYPWVSSRKRLVGSFSDIYKKMDKSKGIEIMTNLYIPDSAHFIAVTGPSGSGKSVATRYICQWLYDKGDSLIMIDPKKSTGARWARGKSKVSLVIPQPEERLVDFLIRSTNLLHEEVRTTFKKQNELYEKTRKIDTNYGEISSHKRWIILEEIEALEAFGPKKQVDSLLREVLLLALLSREANTALLITSQAIRGDVLPIPIRNQIDCSIMLNESQDSTIKNMYPGIESIPQPFIGPGTGFVDLNITTKSIADNGLQPVAMPTIIEN